MPSCIGTPGTWNSSLSCLGILVEEQCTRQGRDTKRSINQSIHHDHDFGHFSALDSRTATKRLKASYITFL